MERHVVEVLAGVRALRGGYRFPLSTGVLLDLL